MDAVWYGIATFMEFIFRLVKPVGLMVDWIFIILIAFGSFYWLYYDQKVTGSKMHNFFADHVEEKE